MAIDRARLTLAADQAAAACTNLQTQCANATALEFMALLPLLERSSELSAGIKRLVAAIEATETEARPAAPAWTPVPLDTSIEIPF